MAPPTGEEGLASVRDYERQIIISMLRKHRKANRVAQMLGIARSTLYRKCTEFGINPGDYTGAVTDADSEAEFEEPEPR